MVRQAHHPEPVEGQYPNSKLQKNPPDPLYKRGKTGFDLTRGVLFKLNLGRM